MERKRPRRRFLVDVRGQGPFVAKVVAIWAGGTVLLCALLYLLADEELGRSFYSIHQRIRSTWEILLPAVALSGALSFLATIVVTIFFLLHESRRLGGPVYKFGQLFGELAEGSFDPAFRFRKGDFLYDLQEKYRGAMVANGERIRALQEELRVAEEALDALPRGDGAPPLPPEAREALDRASRHVRAARERASAFRAGGSGR